MTTRYFGLNRGEQAGSVTKDTSTTSKSIELAVNDAVGLKKNEILVALRQIEQAILDDRSTPFV